MPLTLEHIREEEGGGKEDYGRIWEGDKEKCWLQGNGATSDGSVACFQKTAVAVVLKLTTADITYNFNSTTNLKKLKKKV